MAVYETMIGTAICVNINIEEIIDMSIIVFKVVIKLIGKTEVQFIYPSFVCQER